jgi:uncharacterized RDD family membrane protein YckC
MEQLGNGHGEAETPGERPGMPPTQAPWVPAVGAQTYGQPPQAIGQYAPVAVDPPGYYMGRRLADWGPRVLAALIDSLIGGAPALLFILVPLILLPSEGGEVSTAQTVGVVVVFSLTYLAIILIQVYNRCFLMGRTGQSWGKRVVHLRLVGMADRRPIGAGSAFVREICHVLDGIAYIGYLWPLWDDRRQTFADKIMTTVVLDERT